jgi:hypothetical protein
MPWHYQLQRFLSIAMYFAVAGLLLYPGLVLVQADLINSRILFPAVIVAFLFSSPPRWMRQ